MTVYVAWAKPDHDWDHVGEILGVYDSKTAAQKHCKAWDGGKDSAVVASVVKSQYGADTAAAPGHAGPAGE